MILLSTVAKLHKAGKTVFKLYIPANDAVDTPVGKQAIPEMVDYFATRSQADHALSQWSMIPDYIAYATISEVPAIQASPFA